MSKILVSLMQNFYTRSKVFVLCLDNLLQRILLLLRLCTLTNAIWGLTFVIWAFIAYVQSNSSELSPMCLSSEQSFMRQKHYYTSDSLWKMWLVESIQSIHNSLWTWHDKCNICCRYCIYHVKFNVCLVTKPLGVFFSETKWLNASLLLLRMIYVNV